MVSEPILEVFIVLESLDQDLDLNLRLYALKLSRLKDLKQNCDPENVDNFILWSFWTPYTTRIR